MDTADPEKARALVWILAKVEGPDAAEDPHLEEDGIPPRSARGGRTWSGRWRSSTRWTGSSLFRRSSTAGEALRRRGSPVVFAHYREPIASPGGVLGVGR